MFMSSAFYSALILWQPLFFSVFCVDRGFHSDTCFSCHSPGSQSPEKMKTHRGYLPRLYRQMYTSYMDCGDIELNGKVFNRSLGAFLREK